MKTAVISFTDRGNNLNDKICCFIDADGYKNAKNIIKLTEKIIKEYKAIVFIGAAGIAVRSIAPFIKSKDVDPAVIVCDEHGKYIIPILSGHIGGANSIAEMLALKIGGEAVITTATDINGIWSVDNWAVRCGFTIANKENIKYVSSALLRGEPIGLECDFKIDGKLPENVVFEIHETGFTISPYLKKPFKNTLNLVPRCINLGVGCKKGAKYKDMIGLFDSMGISDKAVKSISTIDIKKNEPAILALSEYINVPIYTYSAAELNSLEGEFSSSEFVRRITGTDNVCERAAVMSGGKLIIKKVSANGITMAASMSNIKIDFGV